SRSPGPPSVSDGASELYGKVGGAGSGRQTPHPRERSPVPRRSRPPGGPAMPVPLTDALDQTGRVVIVTGGTKGVGRGITERFLEAGAEVVVTARHEPDDPISGGGREAAFIAADIRDIDQIDTVV